MLKPAVLEAFTKTYPDQYLYTTTVRHKGAVIALAMDKDRRIYYTVLNLDGANRGQSSNGGTGASDQDETLDVNYWQNLQELRFPTEIAEVGYGVADQTLLPVFKNNKRTPEKPETLLPDEASKDALEFDFFLSTTARFTAAAPFQALSDQEYVYIFRQAIADDSTDAGKHMVFVDRKGNLACWDNGNLVFPNPEGKSVPANRADFVPLVNSTLLVDRFVLAGDQAQTKTLQTAMEVRFQRSRSKTRPANRKDSLGAQDLDGKPFLEPTQELKFVSSLRDGRFIALLLPTQIAEIERWQIFAHNAKTGLIDSYSVERAKDGLFNTKGSQFYTSPDPKYRHAVFEAKPGKDPFTGKDLVPLVSDSGEAESALEFNGVSDYVDLDKGVKLGQRFTLEAWIAPARARTAQPQTLIASNGLVESRANPNAGPAVWIEGQTRLLIGWGDGQRWQEVTTRNILTLNAWNHVAVTFDGAAISVYINGRLQEKLDRVNGYENGVLLTESQPDGSAAPQRLPLTNRIAETPVAFFGAVEAASGAVAQPFSGKIDELRLWGRARSERELQADWRQRLTGQEFGLIGYWRFDEAKGSALYDQTDYKTNGTLHGGRWIRSDAPVGEGMGVVRQSFQVASLDAANSTGQPMPRRVESGLTALLYYQQVPVASGYTGKPKPLKQNARVMLAMATKAPAGEKSEIAALDFGVARTGKLAQISDLVLLETINAPQAEGQSLNDQLDQISSAQEQIRSLTAEIANLDQEIDAIAPQLLVLNQAIVDPAKLPNPDTWPNAEGFSADLFQKLQDLARAAILKAQQSELDLLNQAQVIVYKGDNYQGESLAFDKGFTGNIAYSELFSKNFNDQIASLKVPKGFEVTVYEDNRKDPTTSGGGRNKKFTEDGNVGSDWKGKISDLDVQSARKADLIKIILQATETVKRLTAEITPIQQALQSESNRLTALKTTKETALTTVGTINEQLLATVKSGVSVSMKSLGSDSSGLTIAGGILGFAWTGSGSDYTPLLFDSATGNLALYFRGLNNQFFVAYYSTQTQPAQYLLLDESGQAQVQCVALSSELEMDSIVIKIEDGGKDEPNYCKLTIAGPEFTETWNRVPRRPEEFVRVLGGEAGNRRRVGTGRLIEERGQEFLLLDSNRSLEQGTTLVVGQTKVTVAQKVAVSPAVSQIAAPAQSANQPSRILVNRIANQSPAPSPNQALPVFLLEYDYALQAESTKVASDLYNGSLLIGCGVIDSPGNSARLKNQRLASGSTLNSRWKANAPGYTLTFNGVNSYASPVESAKSEDFAAPNDVTLEAWVKPNTPVVQGRPQQTARILQHVSEHSNYALGLQRRPGLFLDGQKDYVTVPLNEPETEITHELWFKASSADCGIFSAVKGALGAEGHDRHIYLSGGNIKARLWNDQTISSADLNLADGDWHHVAHVFGTIDGQKGQRLYVDGKEVARGDRGNSDLTGQDTILIGYAKDAQNPYFSGAIDEVRIWKRARSLSEIQQDMDRRLLGTEADLIGYWHFEEASGTTVKDYSPNKANGALKGAIEPVGRRYALFAGANNQFVQSRDSFPPNSWNHLAAVFRQSWGLKFDGKGGYLDCGNDSTLDIRQDLTIEVFLKVELPVDHSTFNVSVILSKGDWMQTASSYSLKVSHRLFSNPPIAILTFGDDPDNRPYSTPILLGRFYKIAVTRKYETTTEDTGVLPSAFVTSNPNINDSASSKIRDFLKEKGYLAERRFETGYTITNKISLEGLNDISELKTRLGISDEDWGRQEQDYLKHIRDILSRPSIQAEASAGVNFYVMDCQTSDEVKLAGSSKIAGLAEAPGNSAPVIIGGTSSGKNGLIGVISEVRIWNTALAKSEIARDLNGDEEGLVSWWQFEEKQGDTAYDSMSQNHGTIKGKLDWIAEPDDPQSRLTLYCNGEKQTVQKLSSENNPFTTSTHQLTLGALKEADQFKDYFQGELEEVRIWKVVRTQEQIRDNLFRRLMGDPEDLLAYYTFDPEPPTLAARAANPPIRITDHSFLGNHLDAVNSSYIFSTAPISEDTPQIRSALAGIKTPFSGPIESPPAVQEYGDMQYDATGNLIGVFKRCYSYIQGDQWQLITGFKVGDLITEWVGQVQFAPQLIGYIEGAPPVPSENLTFVLANNRLTDYTRATSIELVQAENTTYSYAASKSGGSDRQIDHKIGLSGGTKINAGSFFVSYRAFEFEYNLGFQHKHEESNSWLSEATTGVGRTKTASTRLSLRGYAENQDNIAYPEVGRRFVPANVGLALVKSDTADVFALRLKHNNALVSYQMRPNPDIPPDWNIITFPINPSYTTQGSLDGKIGELSRIQSSAYSSYFKPIEAYALKNQIDREVKQNQTYYDQFDSVGKGRSKPDGGLKQPRELRQLQDRREENSDLQSRPGSRLPQFQKRNLVNTYVWTADGGLFAESQETMDIYQEKLGGSYALKSAYGFYADRKVKGTLFGIGGSLNGLFGGRLNQSVTKSQDSRTAFSLRVDFERVESDIFLRKSQDELDLDLSDANSPKPKRKPGRVDAYRFMSFYLEPKSDYFDSFFNQVVDPIWLEQSDDPDAAALREARQENKKPPCWRIMHRVTYVSRVFSSFDQAAPPSLEKTLQTLDINSNYELIKQLEPFVSDKLGSDAEFKQAIQQTVETYLPELRPHLAEIQQYMSLYFGVLQEAAADAGGLGPERVRVANQPPIALAGSDQVVGLDGPSKTVKLEGNAIDDRINPSDALFVVWEANGAAVKFQNPYDLKTEVTFTQRGQYLLRLKVSDGSLEASDEVTLTVNERPVVSAGANRQVQELEVTLTGVLINSGLGGPGNVTYKWTQQSKLGKVEFFPDTALVTTARFQESGNYLLKLTADNGTFSADAEVMIAVAARATENLQVLYTFNSTTATVPDVSGLEPLHLKVSPSLEPARPGELTIVPPGLLYSDAASRVIRAIKASGELTLELWLQPAHPEHPGLARILTLADGPGQRNLILGQSGGSYYVGFRTTVPSASPTAPPITDLNATTKALIAGEVSAAKVHLVCIRKAAGEVQLYLNGQMVGSRIVSGNFSGWNESFKLILGNELGNELDNKSDSKSANQTANELANGTVAAFKPDWAWSGKFHLVALYSRALTLAEIQQNFQFGSDTNLPPVISAGSDQVINWPNSPPILARLTGQTTHDRNPQPGATTIWTQVAGPNTPNGITFTGDDPLSPMAQFTQNGRYVLRLTVDDGELMSSDEVTITVNQPPEFTVQVDADVALTGPTVSRLLKGEMGNTGLGEEGLGEKSLGEKSLGNGRTVTQLWRRISGPSSLQIAAPTRLETTASFSDRGVYGLELEVSNGIFTKTQPVAIRVHQAPRVKAGEAQVVTLPSPAEVAAGVLQAQVTLNGEVQDSGLASPLAAEHLAEGLLFEWRQIEGAGQTVFAPADQRSTTATFTQGGIYILQFTATNRVIPALSHSAQVTVTVNQYPVVQIGEPQTIQLPAAAELDATVSDDGLPIVPGALSLTWEKVSGTGNVTFSASTSSYTKANFSQAGTYVLKLTASDGAVQASDQVTVVVQPPPRISRGLVVLYPFAEADGTTIHDASGLEPALNLAFTVGASLGGGKLTAHSSTLITAPEAATKLIRALKDRDSASHAITIEAWIKPSSPNQAQAYNDSFPGRIITLSAGTRNRNFTLEQGNNIYTVRLRTQAKDEDALNGVNNALSIQGSTTDHVSHLVYTWSTTSQIARFYRDGIEVSSRQVLGDFSVWDESYQLAIANELMNAPRAWLGEIHLLALYNTELNRNEVSQNFAAGPVAKLPPEAVP